jgi:hypothetical protein
MISTNALDSILTKPQLFTRTAAAGLSEADVAVISELLSRVEALSDALPSAGKSY